MKLAINGLTTNYQLIGNQPTTLVLLHGWGCDWQIFSPIIQELSKKYRLLIPDLPGLGKSDIPPTAWTSDNYADWLSKLLIKLKISTPLNIAGHSFGGKIAAVYLSKHGSKEDKLILIDSAGIPEELSSNSSFSSNLIKLIPSQLKNLLPTKMRYYFQTKLGSTDYVAANQSQKIILKKIVRENIESNLKNLRSQTLIVWGSKDQITPLILGQKMNQLIANSQIIIFTKSSHYPFIDESQKFISEVEKFI